MGTAGHDTQCVTHGRCTGGMVTIVEDCAVCRVITNSQYNSDTAQIETKSFSNSSKYEP